MSCANKSCESLRLCSRTGHAEDKRTCASFEMVKAAVVESAREDVHALFNMHNPKSLAFEACGARGRR